MRIRLWVLLFVLPFVITPRLSHSAESERYALIYNGEVAAEDAPEAAAAIAEQAGLPVRFVSDIAELPSLLEQAAVFIIGGTEDDLRPLKAAFTPEVTAAFETYLRNGGRYLGFCGGGYIASTGWEEEDGFVEMLGIIPAESGDFSENDDPQIVPIRWRGETYPMYFQASPTFELTETSEKVEVFAYYENGEIAGLMSSYGSGKVAVCGPHPEARESWSDDAEDGDEWTSTTDLAVALLQELLSDRQIRK
ncbi:hypothetical protein U14_03950 [Candidatus Moduliflexus flocculans]|uniref:Biotin-protein ligase N-terminal domain-containing protein n=1 Tax=Candidatus Moduliflexus flocculans TaxID=1499966 RepID=A0A0S6VZM2_9BACT|nr:hypothetical protein U14_03950 [Candidatus Moduliflexus flocculans]